MKQTYIYQDEKSSKFWTIETNGAEFTVTYGKTGTAGQSQTKTCADEAACNKEVEKLIKEKMKKGYAEEGATSTPKVQVSKAPAINDENFKTILTPIPAEKAEELYNISEHITFPFLDMDEEGDFPLITCLYKSNLHVSSITTGTNTDSGTFNLIVDGDLTVDGDIDWAINIDGSFLFVTGNLKAKNVLMKGCPNLYVQGNVEVENGIMGEHGDDGGEFKVSGTTKAQVIVNTYYFSMEFGTRPDAIIVDNTSNINCDPDFDEPSEALLAKFIDEDEGNIDTEAVYKALKAGKQILKASALSVREKPKKKFNIPENATELDLSSKKLRSIPDEVFELPNLRKLNLNYNENLKTISPRIAELTQLEELEFYYCNLESLPPEIGELKSLKELYLCNNVNLKPLPAEMAKLSNLQKLSIGHLKHPFPDEFIQHTKLEDLFVHRIQTTEAAESIFKLKTLKKLKTYEIAWGSIGARFVNFEHLEELKIDSLGLIKEVSALPKLKHLKVLHLDGYYNPEPKPAFFMQSDLWNIPSLEELKISTHSKVGLKQLPDDAFSNMPKLRKIDFNYGMKLEKLPEPFFNLKHLEDIELNSEGLSKETIQRIKDTFPTAKLNLKS